MTGTAFDTPSMPEAEQAFLREAYREARVILEYGTGGSTMMAARMGAGKYVLGVESDRDWARSLRAALARDLPGALVTVLHVDIGPTGAWGRPLDDRHWHRYHAYPNAIWDAPFFRQPDVVLVDGRFRTACLLTTALRTTRPVRVLFDDYATREKYRLVERVLRPVRLVGRMAEFRLDPGMLGPQDMGLVASQYFEISPNGSAASYRLTPQDRLLAPQDMTGSTDDTD